MEETQVKRDWTPTRLTHGMDRLFAAQEVSQTSLMKR